MEFVKVTGPAGKQVLAKYGIIRPTNPGMEEIGTAIMEMSQAAGITQVTDQERNPLYTTTYGVGQMITDAIHKGFSAIFGPQKGATQQMVKDMDEWLADYAKIAKESFVKADSDKPRTGQQAV